MIGEALKLSVYFGDSLTTGRALTSDVLMASLAARAVRLSVLLRGFEGFGMNRRIRAERFPDISTDLPLLATAIDERDRIEALLDDVDRAVPRGLVTLEPVVVATGDDVAEAAFPPGAGAAAQLTVYCGRGETMMGRPAYRAVVDVLRRHGAGGAIVLLGVDGTVAGRRTKARLFSANRGTPVAIVSVGSPGNLETSLRDVRESLPDPVVTLETVSQLKHDGAWLERPRPSRGADDHADVWHALNVYARQSALVGGTSLHRELMRRIREAGGAGATTLVGEWGFFGDEPPYGDRLGRVAGHLPAYTVLVDRPHRIADLWPIVDDVTAEHGVVTWLVVPGYRERAGDAVHGTLRV